MNSFTLDSRLQNDCHQLGRVGDVQLLLMDNGQLPWFVLVPQVTQKEFYLLEEPVQLELLKLVNTLCDYIKTKRGADKLNVASIGNVVSQLHLHVVGRYKDDYCWPGVVWGVAQNETCQPEAVLKVRSDMMLLFASDFISSQ